MDYTCQEIARVFQQPRHQRQLRGTAANGRHFVFLGDLTAFADILLGQFGAKKRMVDHLGNFLTGVVHRYLLNLKDQISKIKYQNCGIAA
jgi:hypothetical protein